jgi:hypothetical protein
MLEVSAFPPAAPIQWRTLFHERFSVSTSAAEITTVDGA